MLSDNIYMLLRTCGGVRASEAEVVVAFVDYACSLPSTFDGKDRCEFAQKCIKESGQFPKSEDYKVFNLPLIGEGTLGSRAGIDQAVQCLKDDLAMLTMNKSFARLTNESTEYTKISEGLSETLERINTLRSSADAIDITPILYQKMEKLSCGMPSGIQELDKLTNGFQRKSILTIGAFTGHGKSTLIESIVYNNAKDGKKCLIFSLELPPDYVWSHFEQRYAYEHGIETEKKDFSFRALKDSVADQVIALQDDFMRDIGVNLAVIDESSFATSSAMRKVLTDFTALNNFLGIIAKKLGGLDIVVFDHVNQIELMYPECGNRAVKTFQSSVKTFKDERGLSPLFIQAVQCNREGYKYAISHDGKYINTAIGDLNEVERSSAYVVFLYTDDEDRHSDNTRVSFTKHRYGQLFDGVVNVSFRPDITKVGNDFNMDLSNDTSLIDQNFSSDGDLF